ncbi:4-(cytidine 5'-diphospho)-2-C-methyl-D-erythritol kinase [Bifidobacterium sp. SMB2]|uniref:4-diphosphocytidyl-2-C-methyl-D-erythritol kinase n=1 Tax=Bifidobacterium saimiriisciurei TaxID=2661627 RepID=A0ABX0C948_9BIFI|nr:MULTISPECIES: 4-(cytidine 5'-diphospho)-2-C-methyl-D-erythritol kinase [Bifidobacterium]NEG95511.1 4-(cytidine 5'-diphospho)-2-C-methyl-D-erythritol kinase [Bifidobacterium sp. SMB2]NEH11669.1 4-(cytidine 5'-diphospho)-2-C-methyl-D-erythritol kinase [Bifidobacterium saimiriisciurei]
MTAFAYSPASTATPASTTTRPGTAVRVECPAKTNLTLEVGEPVAAWGGRHRLDTIYCAVGIYDTVTVTQKEPGTGFSLDISGAYLGDLAFDKADMRRNHAVMALFALAEAAGKSTDVAISLEKRIPVGAGLGGGSSDAAGTLLALNRLWNLDWAVERLQPIAATLGADMPFCLSGGLARGTGYGERIERISTSHPGVNASQLGMMVVGAYNAQLSTPEVYRTFDVVGTNAGEANHLQKAAVALHPRSGEAIAAALDAGASSAFVSGSGPSVVACVPDERTSAAVCRAWQAARCVDRLFETSAPVTPIVSEC